MRSQLVWEVHCTTFKRFRSLFGLFWAAGPGVFPLNFLTVCCLTVEVDMGMIAALSSCLGVMTFLIIFYTDKAH